MNHTSKNVWCLWPFTQYSYALVRDFQKDETNTRWPQKGERERDDDWDGVVLYHTVLLCGVETNEAVSILSAAYGCHSHGRQCRLCVPIMSDLSLCLCEAPLNKEFPLICNYHESVSLPTLFNSLDCSQLMYFLVLGYPIWGKLVGVNMAGSRNT